MERVDRVIAAIRSVEDSSFLECKEEWLTDVENRYPGVPEDLKYLYRNLGYGCIGNSRYSVQAFLDPDEIYDRDTAESLNGIIIVGDDCAGQCDAYNAADGWKFGSIILGEFEEADEAGSSFIDFLADWFCEEESDA